MDKLIKNIVGIVLIIALLAASYGIFIYTRSYSQLSSNNSPSLIVSSEGEVVAVPDVAKFSFAVITQGGLNIVALQSENTLKMNRIINLLKKGGLAEKDIKTTGYSINPRYDFSSRIPGSFRRPGEIIGYVIEQSVEVTVRDFSQIGNLLSGVTESGANAITNFRFTFDDPMEMENEARAKAMTLARKKAELIARTGGFRLGRLLAVDQGGYYPINRSAFGLASEKTFDDGVGSPQIEPGSEKIVVTVNLRYEIKD